MKRSMYCTICTPQKVSNMASDLIRVPRKNMKHHETIRFGSAKMGCAMGCAEGSFHLAIGSPSIPNFYRSFWSRIKSTSRSFWRVLQDSQVDLYVPRVLPSITTFRLCFVFQCQFDCSLRRKLCPLGCATTGTIRRIEVFRWGPWNSMDFGDFGDFGGRFLQFLTTKNWETPQRHRRFVEDRQQEFELRRLEFGWSMSWDEINGYKWY